MIKPIMNAEIAKRLKELHFLQQELDNGIAKIFAAQPKVEPKLSYFKFKKDFIEDLLDDEDDKRFIDEPADLCRLLNTLIYKQDEVHQLMFGDQPEHTEEKDKIELVPASIYKQQDTHHRILVTRLPPCDFFETLPSNLLRPASDCFQILNSSENLRKYTRSWSHLSSLRTYANDGGDNWKPGYLMQSQVGCQFVEALFHSDIVRLNKLKELYGFAPPVFDGFGVLILQNAGQLNVSDESLIRTLRWLSENHVNLATRDDAGVHFVDLCKVKPAVFAAALAFPSLQETFAAQGVQTANPNPVNSYPFGFINRNSALVKQPELLNPGSISNSSSQQNQLQQQQIDSKAAIPRLYNKSNRQ